VSVTPPTNFEDDRLAQLAEGQLKGELSAGEKAELAELLDSCEDAQRRFVELASFETALTEAHRDPSPEFSIQAGQPSGLGFVARKILPWVAVAACLILVFWLRGNDPVAPGGGNPSDVLATLVNHVDATFVTPGAGRDGRFSPGTFELATGTIHLRFSNGADLVIESPAKFALIDSLHADLKYGTVRAIVPPSAKGFTIATRSAIFEDVGTEFGLQVERETGKESLLVFDGQVNVRKPKSNELVKSVLGGEAFQYKNGKVAQAIDVLPGTFPAPSTIGVRQWRSKTSDRLKDASLIGLFSFERDANQPAVLRNVVTSGIRVVSDARIQGARWGSGRWQGKDALLFDGQDQFAQLNVAGQFKALTIATWIRVNRLDHTLNAVFDSNGWASGNIHLQIQRHGAPYADFYESRGGKKQNRDVAVPIGKWTHLVATYSLADRRMRVYVNGQQAYECSLPTASLFKPGDCRIGNWLPVDRSELGSAPAVRSFNGRIDELAIWNRVLSDSQIQTEMKRGQPSFVWARQEATSP
jgi:hypothetical protein